MFIYADFNNRDVQGRLRLNCNGSTRSLTRLESALSLELSA